MFRQSLNRLFGSAASTVRPVASRQVREWYHSQRRRFASSSSSAHRGSEAGADWNVPLMVAMGAFAGAVTYVYQATAPESFEAPSSAAPHTPSLAPSSSPSVPSPASSTPSLPRTSSEDPAKAASVPKKAQILEAGELHATYVLVGGGTACFSAMRGIMDKDRKARILVIAGEDALPYARPPLSKEMWFSPKKTVDAKQFIDWNGQQRDLVYKPSEFYCTPEELMARPHDEGGVAVLTGTTAVRLELRRQRLTLSDGRRVTYDKCLLATGAQPVEVPLFIDSPQPIADHVTLFRRHDDFVRLDGLARSSIRDVAVVGGSFLGSELSVALAQRAQDPTCSLETVTQIFPEQGNLARVFPRYLSEWTTQRVRDQGVRVVPHARVHSVAQTDGGRLLLGLSNGDSIVVDEVVMAVGVTPNVELARRAGLEIDRDNGGIIANAELETRSNVYVAGDCASFHDITLGRRRVEHHDHAVISGRLAGENMAGGVRPYAHQSMFWSDLGPKVGFEAVGLVDSSLETVGVWAHDGDELVSESASELAQDSREYNKGVVFYMRDRHVVGVLLWNMFGKTGIARRLVRLGHPFSDVNDLVHIFNVHESEKAENDDESSQEK